MKSEAEMLKYRNFGKKSLNEIKDKLVELGLGLGMSFEPALLAGRFRRIARDRSSVRRMRLRSDLPISSPRISTNKTTQPKPLTEAYDETSPQYHKAQTQNRPSQVAARKPRLQPH